jgi:hypothetical protein
MNFQKSSAPKRNRNFPTIFLLQNTNRRLASSPRHHGRLEEDSQRPCSTLGDDDQTALLKDIVAFPYTANSDQRSLKTRRRNPRASQIWSP